MLRLQDNNVVFNNSETIGHVKDLAYVEGGFSLTLPDGSIVFIPEEDCSPNEAEVFAAFHEYYSETGGLPPVIEAQVVTTVDSINAEVVSMIRSEYDENEEMKMLRLGILDPENAEFLAYNAYIEECREWGRQQKESYGLTT
ncbi:MAG: hypothetical protein N2317_08550 [Syntrophales bacterium]|nr:hypothetical protein [Syntrophales bacterium]